MMSPTSLIAILPILLFSSVSSREATSKYSAFDNFLICLPRYSHPSSPISAAIYTPSNSSFSSVLQTYAKNPRFFTPSTPKPLAIIAALHKSHVQATVICAKAHGLQIRIRSGGHDYEGLSYVSQVPFVILDLFNLRTINIDMKTETAWVHAGAILGELYYKIANTSKVHAFPAGVCPGLGTGGHFSGGGYGNLMRKYGLSVDNIIDALIVDANGRILDRKSMGNDLFWAIRGGGGASFGVILAWKIKLVRVPDKVTVFKVPVTLEQGATDVLYSWQHVASKLPEELFIRAMPMVVNGNRKAKKTILVNFIGLFLGRSPQLLPLMNKTFPELNLKRKDCLEMSWLESTLFWFNVPNGKVEALANRTNFAGGANSSYFKSKSDYVKNVIPKEGLEHIWRLMLAAGDVWMQWNPYGGKMSEIPESAVAFPHRAGNLFKIQYYRYWFDDKLTKDNIESMRWWYAAMAPYVSSKPRETFLNYRDIDIGSNPSNQTSFKNGEVYGSKYFKGNFERLMKVKAEVDPDNFFRYEQSIPLRFSY